MAQMTLGADKKSLVRLGIVLAVLVGVFYYQFFREIETASPRQAAAVAAPAPAPTAAQPAPARGKTEKTFRRGERFRPKMGRPKSAAPPDLRTVDPTLRLDLLAGVRGVTFEAVERDIFNFGVRKAPPPPSEEKTRAAQQRLQEQLEKQQNARNRPKKQPQPGKPAMPRLTWKYYGFAGKPGAGSRRGFLLDGEEILIGGEGEVFQKRYKIKRIGLDSIVIEDLQFRQEQTLALTDPS